ncbi:hypothetical protein FRC03_012313 [Tulasnella sp. 419]|nr:hypothetical protein FRC02_011827 [Tulasnella sp. 418]KAG8966195.1 hypothetical protein FRC03_012313 [Tulasnella sp. 419]
MPRYVPQQNLENLKKYKYSAIDKSILSKYVLNPFWNKFVTIWPLWVAPNTITFMGLCLVLFNLATLVYYDPHYLIDSDHAGPPKWIYFTWAAGLFWYQAFDAIDGKQARRTNMAGPLGQMFDHGCDAMNTTFEVILAARALNVGRSWWTVASEIGTIGNFYLTTWEEFHTGTLYLGVFSGPVEGIILIVVIYIISGIYGATIWDTKILAVTRLDRLMAQYTPKLLYHVPNLGLNEAFFAFGALGLLFNIAVSYRNVYRARVAINKSPFTPLGRLFPFFLTIFLNVAWISGSGPLGPGAKDYILKSSCFLPLLGFWAFGFAHMVGKMILAHLSKGRFPYWDWRWAWTLMAAVDANAHYLFNRPPLIQKTPKATFIFVIVSLALSLITYVRFCTVVIQDITEFLGIACFTVRKKDKVTGEWFGGEQAIKRRNS